MMADKRAVPDAHAVGDLFLAQRFAWTRRALFLGLPTEPRAGDRGGVQEAIMDIVDAAGGLEHSRAQLTRALSAAQQEFMNTTQVLSPPPLWGGRNVPAVYYEFSNVVAWTRGVKDRYGDRLRRAVEHDPALWVRLQRI